MTRHVSAPADAVPARPATIAIDRIIIGARHRKDMGDIDGLATSIFEHGLLHPVVIQPDGTLIAGERRLRAFQWLGRTEIPVTVVDIDEPENGGAAENFDRKDFTLSEAVAIKRSKVAKLKAEAKKRQVAALKNGTAPPRAANLAERDKGESRDKVAALTGFGHTTIAKAEAILTAAEEDPKRFGKLAADMDRTGRVNGPYRRLSNMRQAEAIRAEPPPLPNRGPYRVIVADPPWAFDPESADPSERGVRPYPEMTIAAICALSVGGVTPRNIAHDDAILWLWTTNFHMRFAHQVAEAWGFEPRTILTWIKDRMAQGIWLRNRTEHCLVCVRGSPVVTLTNETTVLHAPVRAHSQKPAEFYAMVERLCPAPRYAELFAREKRERWDGHGDEVAMADMPTEATA